VNAITEGSDSVSPDLSDGMRVLQVIDAAERSAATGKPCRVSPFGVPAR
jgi:hypothetical protein